MMNDDLISRQAAIDAILREYNKDDPDYPTDYQQGLSAAKSIIEQLLSARPTEASCWGCKCPKMETLKEQKTFSEMVHLHDAETHDKRAETHDVCLDTISRQAAIEHCKKRLYETALNCFWFPDGNMSGEDELCQEIADNRLETWMNEISPVEPERKQGEWISCSQPPKDERNVFLARGTNDFKSCCIGHYEHGMNQWYEDKNWFASPIYDCKYWCDIPDLPDMGDKQFEIPKR